MNRVLPALLLILAVPAAPAAGPDLTATEVHVLDGTRMEAHPVVLVREGATASTHDFLLTADALRVETDEREAELLVAGTEAHTVVEHHRRAVLEGVSLRYGARLFVVPGEGATVSMDPPDCAEASPPVTDTRVHAPRVGARPAVEVSLATAVAWRPCTDANVTLRGDLLVVLWSWDARLTSDQGTTLLDSGRGDAAEGDVGARERFLFARNATLTLPPARQTLYVEDLLAMAGTVRLSDAAGELDGARVDGDLSLAGEVEVLVQGRGAGRPMAVTVGGAIDRALLDDRSLAVPGDGWGGWPLLATGVGLVGIVGLQRVRPHLHYLHAERTGGELGSLVPQTLRQRRAVGLWIMARRAETRRRYRTSRRRASRANDLFRPFPEAQFTRAVAAAELGHHADAMTDFLDLYHRYDEPMGRAAAACGMAQQCCRLRKWDVGQEWLLMAAAESLQYAQRATRSPEFDHYDGEAWFDALRRGEDVVSASGRSRPSADPSIH